MKAKTHFIKQLERNRRLEFYLRMIKFLFLLVLIVLSALLSFEKLIEKDLSTGIFLILSLIFFIGLAYLYFKDAYKYYSIYNSSVFNCISNPESVTEILVFHKKIVFEIKDMKNETIFINDQAHKDEIIQNIINIFGNDKVVMNS